eukprot:jgi/Botrbrau1/6629/Bobra.104_2s0016.1
MVAPVRLSTDCMLPEFLPGPQRRILLEMCYYFYPYGNTPAKNLISGRLGKEQTEVLILGCGDIRNLLWTAKDPSSLIHFHINDNNNAVLARNLVLLHMLEHLDLESKADLHYLWNVWYNIYWDAATTERFTKDVQEVLECGVLDGPFQFQEDEHLCTATAYWSYACSSSSSAPKLVLNYTFSSAGRVPSEVSEVLRLRSSTVDACLDEERDTSLVLEKGSHARATLNDGIPGSFEKSVKGVAKLYTGVMIYKPISLKPKEEGGDEVFQSVERDVAAYIRTENHTQRRWNSNKEKELYSWILVMALGTCTGIAEPSGKASDVTSVNPTMLDPFTGEWHVHYHSVPHRGFPAVPQAVLKAAAGEDKPQSGSKPKARPMTQACLAMLQKMGRAYINRIRAGKVRVTLWGGNALSLCLMQLSGQVFDVVDTSNLGDHPNPLARLFTETMLWEATADSPQQYIGKCLGNVPQSLYPTLLGLRLLTEFELGASEMPNPFAEPAGAVQQLAAACLVTNYHTELYLRDRSGNGPPHGFLPRVPSSPQAFRGGGSLTMRIMGWETTPYQPGLRMFVGSRAAAEAVAGSMPETLVPTALSKKMHFFDALDCSLSDDCTNLSVQFLLPGDHGLPLASTWAVLADVLSVRNATVGLPTPLSRFTATALGGGIFSQLQAALGINSGISSFPAGDSPNTTAGDPDQRNPVLAISDCRETDKSYDVTIRIDCGPDPSGVELTPALLEAACPRTGSPTRGFQVWWIGKGYDDGV